MVDFNKARDSELYSNIVTGGAANGGLTVRDVFAAHAMQSLISLRADDFDCDKDRFWICEGAFYIADRMISERERIFVTNSRLKKKRSMTVEEAFGIPNENNK